MRYTFLVLVGVYISFVGELATAQSAAPVPLAVNGAAHAAPHGPNGVPYRILKAKTSRKNGAPSVNGPKSRTTVLPPHVFYPSDISNPDNAPTVVTTQEKCYRPIDAKAGFQLSK